MRRLALLVAAALPGTGLLAVLSGLRARLARLTAL
jgi:hypothetical protein